MKSSRKKDLVYTHCACDGADARRYGGLVLASYRRRGGVTVVTLGRLER